MVVAVAWKQSSVPRYDHGSRDPRSVPFSHTLLWASCPASQILQKMAHEDGAVVELKKKKSKKEKGEYMRRISRSSLSALNVKISVTDHEAKRAEIELAKTQDGDRGLEVKEKRKKERGKRTRELAVPQAEDTSGEWLNFTAFMEQKLTNTYHLTTEIPKKKRKKDKAKSEAKIVGESTVKSMQVDESPTELICARFPLYHLVALNSS